MTKRAFDEEEAHKEITRLKKELRFLQKNTNGKKTKTNSYIASENGHKENVPKPSGSLGGTFGKKADGIDN